jgi:hypothetical protein
MSKHLSAAVLAGLIGCGLKVAKSTAQTQHMHRATAERAGEYLQWQQRCSCDERN